MLTLAEPIDQWNLSLVQLHMSCDIDEYERGMNTIGQFLLIKLRKMSSSANGKDTIWTCNDFDYIKIKSCHYWIGRMLERTLLAI